MLTELTIQTIPVHAKMVSMMTARSFVKHVLTPVKHAKEHQQIAPHVMISQLLLGITHHLNYVHAHKVILIIIRKFVQNAIRIV